MLPGIMREIVVARLLADVQCTIPSSPPSSSSSSSSSSSPPSSSSYLAWAPTKPETNIRIRSVAAAGPLMGLFGISFKLYVGERRLERGDRGRGGPATAVQWVCVQCETSF